MAWSLPQLSPHHPTSKAPTSYSHCEPSWSSWLEQDCPHYSLGLNIISQWMCDEGQPSMPIGITEVVGYFIGTSLLMNLYAQHPPELMKLHATKRISLQ